MQQEQPNIFLLIFLAAVAVGLCIAAGGFDDASVRDFNNHYLTP
jgi:hypothetical protein